MSTEAEGKKSKKAPIAQKKSEALIYCGPSLPGGLLNKYTVYQNGLPAHLEEQLKECPSIKRLFVPVSIFPEVEMKIATAGSAENVWYQEILSYIQGKRV